MRYYLAYGSNLNKAQMAHRCPDAICRGKTNVPGFALVFRRGVLTVEPREGSLQDYVPMGVWEISEQDEKNLDRYEGFPRFYHKVVLQADMTCGGYKSNGEFLIYVMNDGFPIEAPSNAYFMTVLQGYVDFDFSSDDRAKLWEARLEAQEGGGT